MQPSPRHVRDCYTNEPLRRLKKSAAFFVALFVVSLWVPQPSAQSTLTLVKAGRLLDPRTGNMLSPAAVLIAIALLAVLRGRFRAPAKKI